MKQENSEIGKKVLTDGLDLGIQTGGCAKIETYLLLIVGVYQFCFCAKQVTTFKMIFRLIFLYLIFFGENNGQNGSNAVSKNIETSTKLPISNKLTINFKYEIKPFNFWGKFIFQKGLLSRPLLNTATKISTEMPTALTTSEETTTLPIENFFTSAVDFVEKEITFSTKKTAWKG